MQAGFALLTCGLVRKKNAGHLMMLNFAAYVFAFLAYYAVGYAFQFGGLAINAPFGNIGGTPTLNTFLLGNGQWGFLGGKGIFLAGPAYDAGSNCLSLFQVVFMETAGYITVGAICKRITFGAFLLCEMFVGAFLYPVFGCWVWGGGWMSQLGATMNLGHGYVDFAGSTVVHAVGGFCAMALALILGPRLGQYGPDGKPRAFSAHNLVCVVTGTFILLFGWMGFNPGSTLGATDLRISVVAINTNLAAVSGSATYLGEAGKGVTGLLYGDTRQFICQLAGATLCAVWAFGATYIVFKVVNSIRSMRMTEEAERDGLDVPEFGLPAYPEDVLTTS